MEEERDSYDERNLNESPYHPHGWSGKLPGPALVRNETMGMGMGMGGTLMVF